MTQPASLLTTWPGHPGDGEIAYVIVTVASMAAVPEARQVSHDRVIEITDNYVLITDGTAQVTHTQISANGTHVITVKGVKR